MVNWSNENPDKGLRLGVLKEDTGSIHSSDYMDTSRQGAIKAAQKKKKVKLFFQK